MSDIKIDEKDIAAAKAAAEKAVERGNFSFLEAVAGRGYPEETAVIYMDEAVGLKLVTVRDEIREINDKPRKKGAAIPAADRKKIEELQAREEEILDELEKSRFLVRVRGFSTSVEEGLMEDAYEKFEREYDEVKNPLTGVTTRREVDSPERNRYFTNLLWKTFIVSVEDPAGNVDGPFTYEEIAAIRGSLPTAARAEIEKAMNRVSMASNWFEGISDEVF